jgi:hypothetical protein
MKLFLSALLLILTFSACSRNAVETITPEEDTSSETSTVLEADFQPTEGGIDKSGDGPWKMRILLATSEDGLDFEKTNVVLADQANVPSIVVDENGWIYIYYSGHEVGDKENVSAVAISQDNGKSWVHKYLNIQQDGETKTGTDPDVEILEDGTFRIYCISNQLGKGNPRIYYAEGTDGINFDYKGIAFDNEDAIDSSTFRVGDLWHQFTLAGNTMAHYHATSEDGESFEFYKKENFNEGNIPYVMANEIQVDGGVRFYAFTLRETDFLSYFSSDGYEWEKEDGTRLSFDKNSEYESKYIKDPAVAKLQDGSYIMAYVTVIPE